MEKEEEILEKVEKQMQKVEEYLNPYATKSSNSIRFVPEECDIRLNFARDIDRIIHAPSYTRYIDKTQVYSDVENDNISRRITHVQFVSRAAKTIARALGLNEDLCEAIALGHDVGHVPFGHFGESILNELSKQYTKKCFAHNLNSVRVFKDVEKRGRGCNLSLQVLDGIMCHNGEMVQEKYAPIPKTKESFLEEYHACQKDESKIKTLIPMTLEGCVVRISDIIGYIGKDIDDARRLDVFDIDTLPKTIRTTLGTSNDEIMHHIIMDIIVQSYGKPYIQMSKKIYDEVVRLKKFNYENIYYRALEKEKKEEIKTMFYYLFDVYLTALQIQDKTNDIYEIFLKNMNLQYLENTTPHQRVIDYLSSMTDRFLERQYTKYK